jgi:hypothetical protein
MGGSKSLADKTGRPVGQPGSSTGTSLTDPIPDQEAFYRETVARKAVFPLEVPVCSKKGGEAPAIGIKAGKAYGVSGRQPLSSPF